MFIAMNRFSVDENQIDTFEEVWKNRESHLDEMEGFVSFQMLKGEASEGVRIYISHTSWNSKEDFKNWTQSDQFRAAHGKSKMPKGVILSHPKFEGYEVLF